MVRLTSRSKSIQITATDRRTPKPAGLARDNPEVSARSHRAVAAAGTIECGQPPMRLFQIATATALAFLSMNPAMAQERIRISSDWGNVTAELADNDATRSLVRMLPITIHMSDHLRQEKTGSLPSPLSEVPRQRDFPVGTLGLWGPDHFVI